MFKFTRYALFADVDQPIRTDLALGESGPTVSIVIRADQPGGDDLATLDRLVAHVREELDYDPMESVW